MRRTPVPTAIATVVVLTSSVVAVAACAPTPERPVIDDTELGRAGSQCLSRDDVEGELCVRYVDEEVSLDATGLAPGSSLTVTGASGDLVTVEVDDGVVDTVGLDGRVIEPPFSVSGTWADGSSAVLTVGG